MPSEEFSVSASSKALLVLGFYLTIVSLVSFVIKEKLFISQAVVSILVGVAVGPVGLGWCDPLSWSGGSVSTKDSLTFELARVVLGVQVLFTGINLPQAYLVRHWRSLLVVLLPLMISMWMMSSLLIWLIIPRLSWLESLIAGACVTPTDPVLAASVVRGRFAEHHVPPHLRDLLAAESGANDGLAFPFIALALHLVNRAANGWNRSEVVKEWIFGALLYECFLSVLIGAILGFIARRFLKLAQKSKLIDHENFLAYGLGLSFFCLGAVGTIGSDDLLACFVAGNSFTFDGFFKKETEDQSFQDCIDSLLDSTIFIYVGLILPWSAWSSNELDLPAYTLIGLVVAILLVRRLPAAMLLRYFIPDISTRREALFFGWFGPIGVGAVYYVETALNDIDESHEYLRKSLQPIIYAVILSSVFVHGVTVPTVLFGSRLSGTVALQKGHEEEANERTPLLLDINGDPSPGQRRRTSHQSKDLERQAEEDDAVTDDGHSSQHDSECAYVEGNEVVTESHGQVKKHEIRK